MIEHHLDETHAILHVQPKSALAPADFEELAKLVDPFISAHGDLAGLIVETPGIPGWSSFSAMVTHLRFVRDHHRHIRKIAVVTDSSVGNLAEQVMSHFVSAEIQVFPAGQIEEARSWILEAADTPGDA